MLKALCNFSFKFFARLKISTAPQYVPFISISLMTEKSLAVKNKSLRNELGPQRGETDAEKDFQALLL